MRDDTIASVGEGTEITVGTAIGDVERAIDLLRDDADAKALMEGVTDDIEGAIADLQTVVRLLGWLAARAPEPEEES